MPLPDQEVIREDIACAKIRSKIDLADAYEQVRVEPNDVPKTLFATIMGTYHSNVVQLEFRWLRSLGPAGAKPAKAIISGPLNRA
jgi:hypothetical protein